MVDGKAAVGCRTPKPSGVSDGLRFVAFLVPNPNHCPVFGHPEASASWHPVRGDKQGVWRKTCNFSRECKNSKWALAFMRNWC